MTKFHNIIIIIVKSNSANRCALLYDNHIVLEFPYYFLTKYLLYLFFCKSHLQNCLKKIVRRTWEQYATVVIMLFLLLIIRHVLSSSLGPNSLRKVKIKRYLSIIYLSDVKMFCRILVLTKQKSCRNIDSKLK